MPKKLSIAAAAVVAVATTVLAAAASRPDHFRVARSATVQASPERLHALISDLRQSEQRAERS